MRNISYEKSRFVQFVKDLMKISQETNKSLAKALNYSESKISRLLNPDDKHDPDADELCALSNHFDVSIDDLILGGNSDKTPTPIRTLADIFELLFILVDNTDFRPHTDDKGSYLWMSANVTDIDMAADFLYHQYADLSFPHPDGFIRLAIYGLMRKWASVLYAVKTANRDNPGIGQEFYDLWKNKILSEASHYDLSAGQTAADAEGFLRNLLDKIYKITDPFSEYAQADIAYTRPMTIKEFFDHTEIHRTEISKASNKPDDEKSESVTT